MEITMLFHLLSRDQMRRCLLRLLDCRNDHRPLKLVMEDHKNFILLDLHHPPALEISPLDLPRKVYLQDNFLPALCHHRDLRRNSNRVHLDMVGGE